MKEKISELVVILVLMSLFLITMVYFIKAGDCQNRVKWEGNYTEDTPFDCMMIKNLDIGSN